MMGNIQVAEDGTRSLVDAATGGDVAAFAMIVAAHHQDMVRVCELICDNPDLAQDAAQAAWPIAWRRLGSLREHDRLKPWLVTIAANEARQLLRRERRERVVPIEVIDLEGGRDPATSVDDADLLTAFRRLAPADRQLLAMRYVAGFDSFEIAAALGGSASGIRTRLSRLLARLREELGDA